MRQSFLFCNYRYYKKIIAWGKKKFLKNMLQLSAGSVSRTLCEPGDGGVGHIPLLYQASPG
jgi:hypothetical protein